MGWSLCLYSCPQLVSPKSRVGVCKRLSLHVGPTSKSRGRLFSWLCLPRTTELSRSVSIFVLASRHPSLFSAIFDRFFLRLLVLKQAAGHLITTDPRRGSLPFSKGTRFPFRPSRTSLSFPFSIPHPRASSHTLPGPHHGATKASKKGGVTEAQRGVFTRRPSARAPDRRATSSRAQARRRTSRLDSRA